MKVYEFGALAEQYGQIVADVRHLGRIVSPRDKPTAELSPVTLVCHIPEYPTLKSPVLNYRFAVAEYMVMWQQHSHKGWLEKFIPTIGKFAEYDEHFHGSYGIRLSAPHGLYAVVAMLKKDRFTRQAVINIWNNGLDIGLLRKRDHPCNISMMFLIREDGLGEMKLNMTVTQRSSDVVWGLPYDHFVFSALLCQFAHLLQVKPGTLTRVVNSLHIYEPEAGYYNQERIHKAIDTSTDPGKRWRWNFDRPHARFFDVMQRMLLDPEYDLDDEATLLEAYLTGELGGYTC